MFLHQLDTYKDGYQNVPFCEICSAEGEKLHLECVGISVPNELEEKIKNIWKDVDKKIGRR